MPSWKLISTATLKEVKVGDSVRTQKGSEAIVTELIPPAKGADPGLVEIEKKKATIRVIPQVIGCKYVPAS